MDQHYKPEVSQLEKTVTASATEVDTSALKQIDTVHNDEATKVLATYTGDQDWTEQEEKQVLRRVDWKVLPVLCLTYMLQYYDKAMISQAAIFGLRDDLELTGNRYSYASAIFYLGFIGGAYPAMVLAQRFPIERVASVVVSVWGLVLLLTITCTNYQGLYAQRFFLGFLEAGISPMFMMIVGSWYKKNEQAFRMGAWYACTGYAAVFSPLINYGLCHIENALSPWKNMYIFAGAITMVWGAALWVILPPDPVRAKGFNDRQRYIATARLRSNNTGVRNTHLKAAQIWELLLDIKFWIAFAIGFLAMIANGPISTFTPIIIKGFGFSTFNALLLVMPAGFWGGTMCLVFPYLAYRFPNIRTWLIATAQVGTTIAALLLWVLPLSATGALLFACYLLPSLAASYALLMGLVIANTAGYTKRTLASAGLYVGYCMGNFVGPLVMLPDDAPRYPKGFLAVVVTALVAGALSVTYRYLCIWENKKRDKSCNEAFEHAYEDDYTDKTNPQFRYTL